MVVEELVEAVPGAEGSPIASASARTVPVHTPSPRGVRGKRGLTPQLPNAANQQAAEEWHTRARELHSAGDDAAALRYCEKSLRLCETAPARSLLDHLRKFGPGSAAAAAVSRVICVSDHYEVLLLPRGDVSEAEVKKAYKKLSLQLHPDRNHARLAEAAFKRLGEAYTAVVATAAASGGSRGAAMTPSTASSSSPPAAPQPAQTPIHTPRPPPRRPMMPDEPADGTGTSGHSSWPHTPRSRDRNPVRRRRWAKALAWVRGISRSPSRRSSSPRQKNAG